MTAADWAPYGIGEPDADGWYPDYRPVPADRRPKASTPAPKGPKLDWSLLGLVSAWRCVIADMAEVYGLDLYDPEVLARPWPGVRTMILALVDRPGTRLREALIIRE